MPDGCYARPVVIIPDPSALQSSIFFNSQFVVFVMLLKMPFYLACVLGRKLAVNLFTTLAKFGPYVVIVC